MAVNLSIYFYIGRFQSINTALQIAAMKMGNEVGNYGQKARCKTTGVFYHQISFRLFSVVKDHFYCTQTPKFWLQSPSLYNIGKSQHIARDLAPVKILNVCAPESHML